MVEARIRDLLVATSNKGKIAEISDLLAGSNWHLLSLADLPRSIPIVEETATTFLGNALIKAEYYSSLTGLVTLADDSGLEVDALGGRPGVLSARYGGEGLSSTEQINLLLNEMKDVPEARRTARFVCCIAIAMHSRTETFTGRCEGSIALSPRGTSGFGYDPIFIDPQLGRTFAELTREEKAARSHRGNALREVRKFLIDNK